MKKPTKIPLVYVIVSFLILLIGTGLMLYTAHSEKTAYEKEQLGAAIRMKEAEAYMKDEILSLGIPIEPEDINNTALLGPEFTELTSTPGNPDAKRTALTPDFAAAMVRWYHEAGLKKGDTIAVGSSGSFPGFLIASLCAATEMGLESRVICSLGSSMHGATRPDYNIFDVLNALKTGGFAEFELLAVSPGGSNDQGGGVLEGVLYTGTRELSLKLCEEVGVPVLYYDDLEENIQKRFELYGDGIKLFVSIGGASPNCGTSAYTLNFPQGLVLDPPTIPNVRERGLSYEYASRGIPVLNLLNVKQLASENGIPYDAAPLPEPGTSGVYVTTEYNLMIVIITIIVAVSVLIAGRVRNDKRSKK